MRDLELEKRAGEEDPKKVVSSEDSLDFGTSLSAPIKHPLENTWTLWYYRKESGKSWEDCLKQVRIFA